GRPASHHLIDLVVAGKRRCEGCGISGRGDDIHVSDALAAAAVRTRYLQSLHAFDCPEARKQGLDHGVDGAERHAAAVAPVRLDGSRDALRRLLTEALERRDAPVTDGCLQVSYVGDSELAPQRGGLLRPDSLDLDD